MDIPTSGFPKKIRQQSSTRDRLPKNLDKVRQQYDSDPYPRIPIETSPKEDIQSLYLHNLVTAYYLRNQKVIETTDKVILDAGCGSGYSTLVLAEANPGAKIVGVDFSEKAIQVARQRLEYHKFDNVEFHVMPIDNLPSLGLEFDYINNDEVLYFFPDPLVGLKAMKLVLESDGIIRTNLHSYRQRVDFYRAQEFCKTIGLMDGNPEELEIEILKETMGALKPNVNLKQVTWLKEFHDNTQGILMNYLIQSDRGYTIPEMFALLENSDLEFIDMLRWRTWDLRNLFKEPNDLPAFWAMSLPDLSVEERLHLFELLHPVHRLLDFWCGHPGQEQQSTPVPEWKKQDWESARVYLHPQLKTTKAKDSLLQGMNQINSVDISQYLPIPGLSEIWIDSLTIACLLPLWEGSQSAIDLAKRWHKIQPVDLMTLDEISLESAFETVTKILTTMVEFGYVLVEREG
jgi:ubiquinone/menaquinone biosynthesis C-methylase UbiE